MLNQEVGLWNAMDVDVGQFAGRHVPDLTNWFRKVELLLIEMVTKTIQKKNSVYLSEVATTHWRGSFPAGGWSGGQTATCGWLWTPRRPRCFWGGSIWPVLSSHQLPGCCSVELRPCFLWTSTLWTRPGRRTPVVSEGQTILNTSSLHHDTNT